MQFINDRREMRSQSGFTLIELLVVIAILGILAAVVVFAVGGITDNGTKSACEIEKRTVKTAIQAYKANGANGNKYPTVIGDLTGGKYLESAPTLWTLSFVTPADSTVSPTGAYVTKCTDAGAV